MIIRTDSTQKTSPGIMLEKSYPAVWRMAKEISNFSVLLSGSWFLLKKCLVYNTSFCHESFTCMS